MSKHFAVTKNGKLLSANLYTWDVNTKIFSTKENGLVLDFRDLNDYTFKTGSDCVFVTGYGCTFTTKENCVIIRKDIFEIIHPEINKTIKLNKFEQPGWKYVEKTKTIIIDDKEIEISLEFFESLKKQLQIN